MTFIDTTPAAEARGETKAMYERYMELYGYIPNYARVFCYRPQVMERWGRLLASIRRPMSARRFELVTFAAAHALRNSYCSLVHGKALVGFLGVDAIKAIATNDDKQPLGDVEREIVAFSRRVATDASTLTRDNIDELKRLGLSDVEIFDIAATAAARSFFARLLDALGVHPDATLSELDAELRETLAVGRPIDTKFVEQANAA